MLAPIIDEYTLASTFWGVKSANNGEVPVITQSDMGRGYLVPSVSTASLSEEFSRSFQGPFRHRLSSFAHLFRQSLLLRPGSLLATSTQLTALKDPSGTVV